MHKLALCKSTLPGLADGRAEWPALSLLGEPLALLDVRDVEKLARSALDDRLRLWGAHLHQQDHDDAVAYLVAVVWELSRDYDPAPGPGYTTGQAFSTYAYRRAQLRTVDWFRRRFGDARYPRPELPLSLEAATDAERDQLAGPVTAGAHDPAHDRSPDLVWALAQRDRDSPQPDDAPSRVPAD